MSPAAFAADLHTAVLGALSQRRLDNGPALAARLGIVPGVATALLRRRSWSIDQSLWIIEKASLDIKVDISSD